MSCGPTAVRAVTGKSPRQVCNAIIQAARDDGDGDPPNLDKTNFRHAANSIPKDHRKVALAVTFKAQHLADKGCWLPFENPRWIGFFGGPIVRP